MYDLSNNFGAVFTIGENNGTNMLEGTKKAWVFTPVSEPEWSTIVTPLWTMICQPRPIPAEMWQAVPGVSWVQTCSRASSEVQSRVITRRSAAMAGLRPLLRITLATKRA